MKDNSERDYITSTMIRFILAWFIPYLSIYALLGDNLEPIFRTLMLMIGALVYLLLRLSDRIVRTVVSLSLLVAQVINLLAFYQHHHTMALVSVLMLCMVLLAELKWECISALIIGDNRA